MGISPGGYPNLFVGVVLILLSGWLLHVDRRSAAIRAFAAFLLFTGSNSILSVLAYASDFAPGMRLTFSLWNIAVFLTKPFLLALFLLVFPRPRVILGSNRTGPILLVALLVAGEILYFSAPRSYRTEGFDEGGRMLLHDYGPLVLPAATHIILMGYGAFMLARESLASSGQRRAALLLVSLAFSIQAAWGLSLGTTLSLLSIEYFTSDTGWRTTSRMLGFATAFFLFPTLVTIGRHAADGNAREGLKHSCRVYLVMVAVVMFAAPLTMLVAPQELGTTDNSLNRFVGGVVSLVAVGLIIYALVRHRFLDIDVKVKRTLKQSTVAAIFIGLFFVVSESAAAFFSDRVGTYLGIVAAGALVFAIAPLQHFAQSVADRAMPGVKAVGEMTDDERGRFYADQVRGAWQDGALSRDERDMLERMRIGLGLSVEDAHRLERMAMEGGA